MSSAVDCSGKKPLEGPLKEELEEALAVAERLTQRYSTLLRSFEERMYNTSSVLDFLNEQFSWVSSLANNTDAKNPIFQVQAVSGSHLSGLFLNQPTSFVYLPLFSFIKYKGFMGILPLFISFFIIVFV